MTRRRVFFKDKETGKLYVTPEFNGDKKEFSADSLDSCAKNWSEIIDLFYDVNTLEEFKEASKKAQASYHSFLGDEVLPIEELSHEELLEFAYQLADHLFEAFG
jgi:hypothetical protein